MFCLTGLFLDHLVWASADTHPGGLVVQGPDGVHWHEVDRRQLIMKEHQVCGETDYHSVSTAIATDHSNCNPLGDLADLIVAV